MNNEIQTISAEVEESLTYKSSDQDLNGIGNFIQGSDAAFSQNNIDRLNNTLVFSIRNPLSTILSVDLFGFTTGLSNPNPPPTLLQPLVPVGVSPSQSAFCSSNNFIYTVNQIGNSVSVVDCTANVVVATIPLPPLFNPWAVAYCPVNNQVYVGSSTATNVIRIDCAINAITGPIIITTVGVQQQGITYNSVNNSMYVVGLGGPAMNEINCVTNLAVPFLIPGIFHQRSAFNPTNNRLYVSDSVTNAVEVVDCFTNLPVITIPTINTGTRGIDYCSANNNVYVVGSTSNTVVPIDCATNLVGVAIPVVGVSPQDIAYNPLNNLMYIGNNGSANYVVINCATNLPDIPIALGGLSPVDVVYNPIDNSVWFTFKGTFNVQEILPLSPPTAIVIISGGYTLADLFNDIQGKPLLLKGLKMIVQLFAQFQNNITINYISINGKQDSRQFQPLNYVSPTNRNSLVIDAGDFETEVDGNTQITFDIEPLSALLLSLTIVRGVDNTAPLFNNITEDWSAGTDKTTANRFTGNPIADIAIEAEANKILSDSGYNSIAQYADYPRVTGNPVADIALLNASGL